MVKRRIWMVGVVLGLLVLGSAGWYLGSPLFIDQVVEEDLPVEPVAKMIVEGRSESLAAAPTEAQPATETSAPDSDSEEETPAGARLTAVKSGEIIEADAFHTGSGTATIYMLPEGWYIVRMEQLDVTNGPDLHLYLATGADPTGQDDLGGYLDLGPLKGNFGNQNYEIPAGVDPGENNSIVIYCVPFHVVFAHAEF